MITSSSVNSSNLTIAPSANGTGNPAVQIIRSDTQANGTVQFVVPLHSQDIKSVEAIDLDLVYTAFNGEKVILVQGALQAAMQPNSPIVLRTA